MSYDKVRVIFKDGLILYTMGDGWSVQSNRLHEKEEDAQTVYNESDKPGSSYYDVIPKDEVDRAKLDEEDVIIESQYGSSDRSYREMGSTHCRASRACRLITYGPSHHDHNQI